MSKPRSGNPAPFVTLAVDAFGPGKMKARYRAPKVAPEIWNNTYDRIILVRFAIARSKATFMRCNQRGNWVVPNRFHVYVNEIPLTEEPCGRRRIVETLATLPPVRTVMA